MSYIAGGVVAADIRYNPLTWESKRAVSLQQQYAVVRSLRERFAASGLTWRLLCTLKREATYSQWMYVLDHLAAEQGAGFVGVDLSRSYQVSTDSPRGTSRRPQDMRELGRRLQETGLTVAVHCGKHDSVADSWEAIEVLGATRIGHGLPLMHDNALLQRVRRDQLTVEVCPTAAATVLGVPLQRHPVLHWIDVGVPVVVGSDHPIELKTDIQQETAALQGLRTDVADAIAAASRRLLELRNAK